jgi:hypothetical protein
MLYYRGLALYKQRKYKRALEDFTKSMQCFPSVQPAFAADWFDPVRT